MIGWLNGVLADTDLLRIDPADRGFTLGEGVFETMRVRAGVPVHLARHLARLRHGASVLGIALPAAIADGSIGHAIGETARANGVLAGAARLTLTAGPSARGVLGGAVGPSTLLITVAGEARRAGPARICIASVTRRHAQSPLARIKSLNYGDSILARREAEARGFDDALLLNTDGAVAEATAANLFVRIGDRLLTPRIADGALPGIARGLLIARAAVVETRIDPAMLDRAQAGFLGNALGLRQIARIEATTLGPCDTLLAQLQVHLDRE